MAGVNKVILIGRLGAEPEVKHLQSGSVVANLRLAITESYRNKQGEKVETTEWHDIELWEGLAKLAEQYLGKGDQIYVEGRLKTDSWQDAEGNNRSRVRIRANTMTFLQKANRAGGQYASAPAKAAPAQQQPQQPSYAPASPPAPQPSSAGGSGENEVDDLPF